MLKTGELFCCLCGRKADANRVPYEGKVRIGDTRQSVMIYPKGFKRKPDVYIEKKKVPANQVKLTHEERINGVVDLIGVQIKQGKSPVQVLMWHENRVCPHCGKAGYHPLSGFFATRYIAEVAVHGIGKTTFCRTTVSHSGQKALNKLLAVYGAQVIEKDAISDYRVETATPPETTSMLDGFVIQCQGRKTAYVPIDVAGETFEHQSGAETTQFQMDHMKRIFSVCDAIAVLHDDRYRKGSEEFRGMDKNHGDLIGDILKMNKKKLILAIYTKSDELKEKCRANSMETVRSVTGNTLSAGSRIFRQVQASESREKQESEMALHCARAYAFFREFIESPMKISPQTPCFVISSGTINERDEIDSTQACNAALPIIWLFLQWTA